MRSISTLIACDARQRARRPIVSIVDPMYDARAWSPYRSHHQITRLRCATRIRAPKPQCQTWHRMSRKTTRAALRAPVQPQRLLNRHAHATRGLERAAPGLSSSTGPGYLMVSVSRLTAWSTTMKDFTKSFLGATTDSAFDVAGAAHFPQI